MSVIILPSGFGFGDDPRMIAEMLDAEIDEVSIVDHPATNRALSLFKRLDQSKQRDYIRDETGRFATSGTGGAANLALRSTGKIEEALEASRDPQFAASKIIEVSNALNEAAVTASNSSARSELVRLASMADEVAGRLNEGSQEEGERITDLGRRVDSIAQRLAGEAVEGKRAKAVPEDRDREVFERCVEGVMAQGHTKESAFAICTAGGAGKGATTMTVKQDELDLEAVPPAPEVSAASVVEIPATPKPWPFAKCIEAGMSAGFGQDEAIAVCQLIRQDYGDPSDPDQILVPDGMKPEGLLAAAAVAGGMAKPEGMSAPAEESAGEEMKFQGKPGQVGVRWLAKFKHFLGLDRPLSPAELERQKMERKVRELMEAQEKTKEDLRDIIRLQHEDNRAMLQVLAAGLGVQLPKPAEAPAPTASEPIAAAATAPDPSKAVKEDGAPVVPTAAPAPATSELPEELIARCTALEQENAELRAMIESNEQLMGEAAGAVAPAPAVAVAPTGPKFVRRAAIDPTVAGVKRISNEPDMVFSSWLGVPIPRADREVFAPVPKRGGGNGR